MAYELCYNIYKRNQKKKQKTKQKIKRKKQQKPIPPKNTHTHKMTLNKK